MKKRQQWRIDHCYQVNDCRSESLTPFFWKKYLLYRNISTYCRIRTYKRRYVFDNTYLCFYIKDIFCKISDNNLLDNNVNTVYLYQIYHVILSSFLGIPSEFRGKLDSITWYIFKRSTVFLQYIIVDFFLYLITHFSIRVCCGKHTTHSMKYPHLLYTIKFLQWTVQA